MHFPEYCPECGDQLTKTRRKCACGWKIVAVDLDNLPQKDICGMMTADGPCKERGSVSMSIFGKKWICSEHAEEIRFGKKYT